jgi:hypothetical protein
MIILRQLDNLFRWRKKNFARLYSSVRRRDPKYLTLDKNDVTAVNSSLSIQLKLGISIKTSRNVTQFTEALHFIWLGFFFFFFVHTVKWNWTVTSNFYFNVTYMLCWVRSLCVGDFVYKTFRFRLRLLITFFLLLHSYRAMRDENICNSKRHRKFSFETHQGSQIELEEWKTCGDIFVDILVREI